MRFDRTSLEYAQRLEGGFSAELPSYHLEMLFDGMVGDPKFDSNFLGRLVLGDTLQACDLALRKQGGNWSLSIIVVDDATPPSASQIGQYTDGGLRDQCDRRVRSRCEIFNSKGGD